MKDEELKAQINDIIEGEIQNGINDYLEDKESKQKEQGMGFVNPDEGDELKVKVYKDEVDKIIKEYECDILKSLFIWNFDDSVISLLPPGTVPYKPNENPLGTDHSSLRREQRSLYNFVKGGNDQLSTIRRETIFIQMLEGLHPKEANIIIAVKDGNLEDMYDVPFEVVEDAYPDIQWGGSS